MSSIATDYASAHQEAHEVAMVARTQDVVIAASKALHDQALDERDRAAFRWADNLLRRLLSTEIVTALPTSSSLADDGQAITTLRVAARAFDDETRERLEAIQDVASNPVVSAGASQEQMEQVQRSLRGLRELFTMVGRVSLSRRVQTQNQDEPGDMWTRSTKNSLS